MRGGWGANAKIDSRAQSASFEEFIARVIDELPGLLDELFSGFVGPPERPISFIGRYENLVEDLIRALRQAGELLDEDALRNYPPALVNDYSRFPAVYSRGLAERLAASEGAVIARFYADDPIPERLLR
jgi:hypothetical protein